MPWVDYFALGGICSEVGRHGVGRHGGSWSGDELPTFREACSSRSNIPYIPVQCVLCIAPHRQNKSCCCYLQLWNSVTLGSYFCICSDMVHRQCGEAQQLQWQQTQGWRILRGADSRVSVSLLRTRYHWLALYVMSSFLVIHLLLSRRQDS